jgi:predicted regulator of Ras-like GTPase activity (Roadblock/LC7/MglB family)
MFREVFAEMEATIPDLQAICLVGRDGIEIDSYVHEDLPHEVLSAEMNGLLRNLERLEKEFGLGRTDEMIIRTQAQNILMVALSRDLFVLVITGPSTATGRARYQVQRLAHSFVELLS